jgi:hypothetical protein
LLRPFSDAAAGLRLILFILQGSQFFRNDSKSLKIIDGVLIICEQKESVIAIIE